MIVGGAEHYNIEILNIIYLMRSFLVIRGGIEAVLIDRGKIPQWPNLTTRVLQYDYLKIPRR